MECFIQYHSLNKMEYWPVVSGESSNNWGCIRTKKCMNLIGKRVFLIAGVKQIQNKTTDYFLWCYVDVAEMFEDNGWIVLRGPNFICKQPIRLNDVVGFDELKKGAANFSTGLQDRGMFAISKFITDESHYVPIASIKDPLKWQFDFEEKFIADEYWRDTKRGKNGKPAWISVSR